MKDPREILDKHGHEALLEVERNVYKRSLYHTCKYLLGMGEVNVKTHGKMIKALEALLYSPDIKNALIVMPRGTFKSSIGAIGFPIWLLINDFNKRIMIDSATYDLSTQFVTAIAQYLESEDLTRLFGNFKTRDDWSGRSLTIAQRTKILKEPSVFASGVGSSRTGMHPDVIIMDDLNTDRNSTTQELRAKVYSHYQMNFAILEPGGIAALIGTRYSSDDTIGRVLDAEIGMDVLPDYLKSGVALK